MRSPEFREENPEFRLPEEVTTIQDVKAFFGVSNRDEPVTGETMTIPPHGPFGPLTPTLESQLRQYMLDFLARCQRVRKQNETEGNDS